MLFAGGYFTEVCGFTHTRFVGMLFWVLPLSVAYKWLILFGGGDAAYVKLL